MRVSLRAPALPSTEVDVLPYSRAETSLYGSTSKQRRWCNVGTADSYLGVRLRAVALALLPIPPRTRTSTSKESHEYFLHCAICTPSDYNSLSSTNRTFVVSALIVSLIVASTPALTSTFVACERCFPFPSAAHLVLMDALASKFTLNTTMLW